VEKGKNLFGKKTKAYTDDDASLYKTHTSPEEGYSGYKTAPTILMRKERTVARGDNKKKATQRCQCGKIKTRQLQLR